MHFKRILLTVIAGMLISMPLYSEYVFLKDGSIIEGVITSDAAGSVTIRDKDKIIRQIPRTDIMRILYTELYMGKVYVQKTDGKNIICYMVDEDRESYTFRKELYSPVEFKLKRDMVLFMARGNPTGLEGEADTDSAELKWFSPYNPVKRYRIYKKGPEDKKFILADEIRSKSTTLKDLKSNTKYQLHVTAVDDAGDESIPSNELTIVTKNVAPDKPVITKVELLPAGGYRIAWNPSTDPDGKMTGYKLYIRIDGENRLLAETKKTEYIISASDLTESMFITAYDDLKAESELSRIYFGHWPKTGISVSPAFIYPAGNFKNLAGYGYGATLKFEMSNYFVEQLELSAELSCYTLPGKDPDFPEPENKINGFIIAPLMLGSGYAFYPLEDFALIPNITAGAVYVQYDYNYFDIVNSKDTNVVDNEINPILGAGLILRYKLSESFYLTLSSDYRIFFEESENYSYYTGSFGAGMRF
ncbi:MAG: hypothetical protein CVV49_16360 [Spirochaetae bacterium HGW-Spirochaetae-5]|nr:MAG: hypothetical protein CVV49_16360 [Spirochaetae bacterium HGW-Spirochaetae-5]